MWMYVHILNLCRQSLTFVCNSFLKLCMEVKLYESQAIYLYAIREVLFQLPESK